MSYDRNTASLQILGNSGTINYNASRQQNERYEAFKRDRVFAVPFERDPAFINRNDIMSELDRTMKASKRVALSGIGGVGYVFLASVLAKTKSKSQIAIEYCYLFEGNVFWIYAATMDRLIQAYTEFATSWGFPEPISPRAVSDGIERDPRDWLLVLDNVDDRSMVREILKFLPKRNLIVTTRDRRVGQDLANETLFVDTLSSEDARTLFLSKLPGIEPGSLLGEMDYLPLAITQAAAFIKENRISVKEYLDIYRSSDADVQDLLYEDHLDPRRDLDSPSSVIRTLQISFDIIKKEKPRAAELLSLMAVLDRQGVPKLLLQKDDERPVEFVTAINALLSFSLIVTERDESYGMHRLVQLAIQKILESDSVLVRWRMTALSRLAERFEAKAAKKLALLLPHALKILQYEPVSEQDELIQAKLLREVASHQSFFGSAVEAKHAIQKACSTELRLLGAHRTTLGSLRELLSLFNSLESVWELRGIDKLALDLHEATLGANDPLTIDVVSEMSIIRRKQEQFDEAETFGHRALAFYESTYAEDHEKTLFCLNNLAFVKFAKGNFEEGDSMLLRALSVSEAVHGKYAMLTVQIRRDWIMSLIGRRVPEAQAYMETMIDELETNCDKGVWFTSVLSDFGIALERAGSPLRQPENLVQAEALLQRVVGLWEENLGGSVERLSAMKALASCLMKQKKYIEAEPVCRRAQRVAREILGRNDLRTIDVTVDLATILMNLDALDEAEALLVPEMEPAQKTLGGLHPTVIHMNGILALIYEKQGRYAESEKYHKIRLEDDLASQGFNTWSPINTDFLAEVLAHQGKHDEAVKVCKDIYDRAVAELGADDEGNIVRSCLSTLREAEARRDRYLGRSVEEQPIQEESKQAEQTKHIQHNQQTETRYTLRSRQSRSALSPKPRRPSRKTKGRTPR